MQVIPGGPCQCTVVTQEVLYPQWALSFEPSDVRGSSHPCWKGWIWREWVLCSAHFWGPTKVTAAVQTCQPGPGLWLLLESGHSSRSFVLQWSTQVTNKETRRGGGISKRQMVLSVSIPVYLRIQGNPGLLCSCSWSTLGETMGW